MPVAQREALRTPLGARRALAATRPWCPPRAGGIAVSKSAAEMYREHVLDHYKSPRNWGELAEAQVRHREDNPLCGDDIEMHIRLEGETVADVRFHGQGCAIATAGGSLLTEHIKGKSREEVLAMGDGDVQALLQVPVSPVRMKCATLALSVAQNGLRQAERR